MGNPTLIKPAVHRKRMATIHIFGPFIVNLWIVNCGSMLKIAFNSQNGQTNDTIVSDTKLSMRFDAFSFAAIQITNPIKKNLHISEFLNFCSSFTFRLIICMACKIHLIMHSNQILEIKILEFLIFKTNPTQIICNSMSKYKNKTQNTCHCFALLFLKSYSCVHLYSINFLFWWF